MNQLLSDGLWSTIKRLAKESSSIRAAVAYVTSEEYVKFSAGDVLITDASDHAIRAGQTSAEVLARAFERGAELYSLPGLHTKVLVLDRTAVIGSANLSGASANHLIEAAWLTDAPAAYGSAIALIHELVLQARAIDDAFLERILKIKVEVSPRPALGSARRKKVKIQQRTWIVAAHELTSDFPAEQEAVEAGTVAAQEKVTKSSSDVNWMRWTGNSRFRREAKVGDIVIEIWFGRRTKRPLAVYRHAPILRRQDEDSCTRFFVEEFTDREETKITWREFQRLVHQAGLTRKLGPASARLITDGCANKLYSLWG